MQRERLKNIITAIVAELDRQAVEGREDAPSTSELTSLKRYAVDGIIDVESLAGAIESALYGTALPGEVAQEGPTPAELNSSNDG